MKHLTTLVFIAFVLNASAFAQDVKEIMYKAYLNRSEADWKQALDINKAAFNADKKNASKQLDLAFAYFSLLNGTMATQNEDLFDEHVDDATDLLDDIIESNKKSGAAQSMLANIYGNEIGHSPMKGMLLGSKAGGLASKGKSTEPTSPLVWYVAAVNKYYTPSAFGGSYKEAVENAQKSIDLMEADPKALKNSWMYLDALVLLGNAQLKLEDKAAAKAAYQKALTKEPNFQYAKILLDKVK